MGTDRTPDRGAIAGASQPRTEADRRAAARALGAHYARLRDLNADLARGRDSGPFAELPRVPYDPADPFELIDRFDELQFGTRVRGVEVIDNGRGDNTVTVRTHFDPPRAS